MAALGIAAGALGLAACGGGSSTPSAAATTVAPAGGSSSTAGTSSSAAGSVTVPTVGSATPPSVAVGGPQFCQDLVNAEERIATGGLASLTQSGGELAQVETTYSDLAKQAPSELKAPLNDFVSTFKALSADINNPTALQQQDASLAQKIPADTEALTTWIGTHCTAG